MNRENELGELIDGEFGDFEEVLLVELVGQRTLAESFSVACTAGLVGLPSVQEDAYMHLVFFAFEPSEESIETAEAMFWGSMLNDLPFAVGEVLCRRIEIDFAIRREGGEFFKFVLIGGSAPGGDSTFAEAQVFIWDDFIKVDFGGFAEAGASGASAQWAIEAKESGFG